MDEIVHPPMQEMMEAQALWCSIEDFKCEHDIDVLSIDMEHRYVVAVDANSVAHFIHYRPVTEQELLDTVWWQTTVGVYNKDRYRKVVDSCMGADGTICGRRVSAIQCNDIVVQMLEGHCRTALVEHIPGPVEVQ